MLRKYWSITAIGQKSYFFPLSSRSVSTKKQLKKTSKPLYNFGGIRIEPIGSISLPVSFGSLPNAPTEYITFDVVEMNYPYNAIFRRGLLNTFKAVLHPLYLCLKVPATLGVISIHDSQKDVRNIE
jgi:hypothetical protein